MPSCRSEEPDLIRTSAGTSVRPTILFVSVPISQETRQYLAPARGGSFTKRLTAARAGRSHSRVEPAAYTDRSLRRIGLFPSVLPAPGRMLLPGRLGGLLCCLVGDIGCGRRRRPVVTPFLLTDVHNIAQLSGHGDVTTIAVSFAIIRAPVEDASEVRIFDHRAVRGLDERPLERPPAWPTCRPWGVELSCSPLSSARGARHA